MKLSHIFRVVVGIILSGVMGWFSLLAFNIMKIWQQFEDFEAYHPRGDNLDAIPAALERAIDTMQGGSAVFLAAAIVGVLFSEVFRTRSLTFYVGATGVLTAAFAAAFWHTGGPSTTTTAASALAMAGFVAGGIYWMIASPDA